LGQRRQRLIIEVADRKIEAAAVREIGAYIVEPRLKIEGGGGIPSDRNLGIRVAADRAGVDAVFKTAVDNQIRGLSACRPGC
jgi:hypothetical protein